MHSKLRENLWLILLVTGVLAIYLPGLSHALIYDDEIIKNGFIDQFGHLWPLRPRMLSYGSFVWIAQLFGDGLWPQRLFNILLHLLTVAGIYRLWRDLLSPVESPETHSTSRLQIATLVFALNPVAVYAVAYLVERSILMATLFFVLGLNALVLGLQRQRWAYLVLAGVSYVLALLCKEYVIAGPGVAFLIYCYLRRPPWLRLVLVLLALGGLAAACAFVLFHYYGEIIGKPFDDKSAFYVRQLAALAPAAARNVFLLSVVNECGLFFHYLALWVFPNVAWMSIDLRPAFPVTAFGAPQLLGVVAYLGWLAGGLFLLFRHRDWRSLLGLCMCFPAVLFVTEFSTVWIQDPFVLYRSYLWMLPLPAVLYLLFKLVPRKSLDGLGLVLLVGLSLLAANRVQSMKDNIAAWSDAIAAQPAVAAPTAFGQWRAYINRAGLYIRQGLVKEGMADLDRAEALGGVDGTVEYDRGSVFQLQKQHEEAIRAFDRAEAQGLHANYLYFQRAQCHEALGHSHEAYADYGRALQGAEKQAFFLLALRGHANLALRGRSFVEAIQGFRTILQYKPDSTDARLGLAIALLASDRPNDALEQYDRLLSKSSRPDILAGRAKTYLALGRLQDALRDTEAALQRDPTQPQLLMLRQEIRQRMRMVVPSSS